MQLNAHIADESDIHPRSSTANAYTVLVIEGDPLIARSLELMLQAEGFTVETASDGARGAAAAKDGAFNLIILGVDLPDMSGLEAMGRIRKAAPKAVFVFASLTPASPVTPATLHLSDCCDS